RNDEIISVKDVEVGSFDKTEQRKRGPDDNMPHRDVEWRYQNNKSLESISAADLNPIVPTPVSIDEKQGTLKLSGALTIGYESGLENEAWFLFEQLDAVYSGEIEIVAGKSSQSNIVLGMDSNIPHEEGYELLVSSDQVTISGANKPGVFYGIQSFRGLLPPKMYSERSSSIEINNQVINDNPRFGYRGLHLDVARNFHDAAAVKKLLDVMSFYKLNTFHFHLTDDEGWRLPVESLPELTEVGGRRGHTLDEKDYMMPSYGSGPDPEKAPGSGSYDRETFVEILEYANERHVEVIPEIDVPGHARAAIVAMKSRYEKQRLRGNLEAANQYRLHEPEDESQYRSVQYWDDNVINVCEPSTYRFLETVFDEIVAMYDEAGAPLTTIHMGGDEVPHGVWEKSPACEELISNTALDSTDDLPNYFFERVRQMLAERGLTMAGWEEIAQDEEGSEPNPDFAGKVRPHMWINTWGGGTEDHAYKFANAGYEVVMSQASNFYFDLAYNNHPKEPGLYWAGFMESQYPFAFIPFDLYKNAEENILGNAISEDAYEDATVLTEEGQQNILGLQGQLWSEKLVSSKRMEYMAMPRIFGLAERAWAQQPEWATIDDRADRNKALIEAWNEFANRLGQRELPRMDSFHGGMNYRLSPPGAVVEDDTLKANVAYHGLTIRYTLDGSKPTENSEEYTGPVDVSNSDEIKLRTFSTDGRGSRTVTAKNK
ncbi:MAG: family 20 glycosylhydrolase, partial [Bacteroidota bacterium]